MATIITIHGTNDTGPVDGDKWWQQGGPLEQDLKRWVTGADGDTAFSVVRWSGLNSANARYEGGEALTQTMLALEARAEPYCVIGHSHGGSATSYALGLAEQRGVDFPLLRRWVTVATPFVTFRPRTLLFSRLHTGGVAAYLIVFYIFIIWLAFVASSAMLAAPGGAGLQNPVFDVMIIALAAAVLVGLYVMLRVLQPDRLKISNPRFRKAIAAKYGSRWLGLWHSDDEVINGGRVLKDLQFKPFRTDFASPPLALISLLLIPLAMYVLANPSLYDALASYIREWSPGFEPAPRCPEGQVTAACAGPLKEFARNSMALLVMPAIALFQMLEALGVSPGVSSATNLAILGAILVGGALIGFLFIWLVGIVLHRLVKWSSYWLSAGFSRLLNDLTRGQIVALGYGSDSHGEVAVDANPYPVWSRARCACLPKALEDEITQSSDQAAALTLSRMRAALSGVGLEGDGEPADLLTRHVTWSELIHTNYFRVPRLRKFLAYIVSQQEGFTPTEALRSDPDFVLMGEWYAHILPKEA